MNEEQWDNKIIVIKEGLLISIINDVVTFSAISGAMYLNYIFCGNSQIMNGFFILLFLFKSNSYLNKYKMTIKEAKEYINKLEDVA